MRMSSKLSGMFAVLVIYGLNIASVHAIPISGTTSGIFSNPAGPGGMVVSGVGTSSFTWGSGFDGSPPSSLDFSGTSFATNTGTFFDIGEISYFNGTIALDSEASSVDFDVTLNFTTPGGISETFTYLLSLVNTPNTSDAVASADIVQFPGALPTASFTANGTTYSLGLEVGVVSGSGFSSQTTFSVLEGSSATATLRGIVTSQGVPQALPEPSTIALIGLGLLGMSLVRKRVKVKA